MEDWLEKLVRDCPVFHDTNVSWYLLQTSTVRDSLDNFYMVMESSKSSTEFWFTSPFGLCYKFTYTYAGSAIGFRLDSLLKLTDTRARNNKITLMNYLCKV